MLIFGIRFFIKLLFKQIIIKKINKTMNNLDLSLEIDRKRIYKTSR